MDPGFNIREFLDTSNMTEAEIDRCEFWDSANRQVHESKKYNFEKKKIVVNSNWNLDIFEEWLRDYEDRKVIQYLKYGWPLNAKDTAINQEMPQNQQGCKGTPRGSARLSQKRVSCRIGDRTV